jgi:hypothetical protein
MSDTTSENKEERKFYHIPAETVKWLEECFSYNYDRCFEKDCNERELWYARGSLCVINRVLKDIDKP